MSIIENLNNYLDDTKNKKNSLLDDGSHQVCDLITGECFVVKEKEKFPWFSLSALCSL
jgi:hypothetical protein